MVTANHQELAIRQEGPENCAGGPDTVCNAPFDADWLDNSTVAKRTREATSRMCPEVTAVRVRANQMAAISALEPEIVKQMREILMAAKDRAERAELIVLKPQLKKRAGVAKRSE